LKDGETVRVVRALGTDSKQVAKAKLARLLNEEIPPEQAAVHGSCTTNQGGPFQPDLRVGVAAER